MTKWDQQAMSPDAAKNVDKRAAKPLDPALIARANRAHSAIRDLQKQLNYVPTQGGAR